MAKKKVDTTIEAESLGEQITKELDKAIDGLTLFDDDLMSKVFDKNIPATELLLHIILERDDIEVISVDGQEDLRNPYPDGRNIRLDIHAVDGNGNEFDVEVQRGTNGSHIRRARFHGGMMDSRMLESGQDFKELKDSYVIFICQHDKFHKKKPIYHIDKVVRETGKAYDDGSYTIYVNGKYKAKNALGKLIHDFNCTDADDMIYEPLAKGVRHFKETPEGRHEMCESFEKLANKYAEQAAEKAADRREEQTTVNNIRLMMKNMKCTLEEALNALEISGKERGIIAQQLDAIK